MLKETITYKDYNDVERTEDFYFNLTEAECMKLEMSINGGLTEMIQKVASEQNAPAIMDIFEKFILTAYGQKSLDGKRFVKSEELKNEFKETEAYSILFMKLVKDAEYAAHFINNIVPTKQQNTPAAIHPANK